jgi:hypothetical protein
MAAAIWVASTAIVGCASVDADVASLPCPIDAYRCVVPNPDGGEPDVPIGFPPSDATVQDVAAPRNPLCGTSGCLPDNPTACGAPPPPADSGTPGDIVGQDAGSADANGDGAAAVTASDASDVSSDGGRSDASVSSDGAPGVGGDASHETSTETRVDADAGSTEEPKPPMPPMSCYVLPSGSSVATKCGAVGAGNVGDPCNDSHDCGLSLACVEVDGLPTCRRFSCAVPADCAAQTYYQLEPLRVSGVTMKDVRVPVCVPTVPCELLAATDAGPCGKDGRVCGVVGTHGDTTCVVPGTGKLGDPCDDPMNACAEGLVCSKLKNQCLQICHVNSTECPGGTCQGGNRSLPDGFGICVGSIVDAGQGQ